jgi:putative membrane protein
VRLVTGPETAGQDPPPPGGPRFARTARLWLAPERVREEGRTPDYRFTLANERTFLAWIRTALALVGGGFAVHQFLTGLWAPARVATTLVLLGAGALAAAGAVGHWVSCERAMRRGEDLPVSRLPVLLSALVVGVAVLAMVAAPAFGWVGRQ